MGGSFSVRGKAPPQMRKKGTGAVIEKESEHQCVEDTAISIYVLCGTLALLFLYKQQEVYVIIICNMSLREIKVVIEGVK